MPPFFERTISDSIVFTHIQNPFAFNVIQYAAETNKLLPIFKNVRTKSVLIIEIQ